VLDTMASTTKDTKVHEGELTGCGALVILRVLSGSQFLRIRSLRR
jgi:hypothetical protein